MFTRSAETLRCATDELLRIVNFRSSPALIMYPFCGVPRIETRFGTGFLEFRQLLPDAEDDIDRRLMPLVSCFQDPRFQSHCFQDPSLCPFLTLLKLFLTT